MPGGSIILFAGLVLVEMVSRSPGGSLSVTERKLIFSLGILFIFIGALSIAASYFKIIILIIGIALLGFIYVKSSEDKSSEDKRKLYSVVVVVLISAGVVSLIANNYNNGLPPTAGTPTEVKITSPLDGALVGATEPVKGTVRGIPERNEIWIFVHPHTVNKYYPQRSSAVIQNGEWSLPSPVGIGSDNDDGKKFDIIAVLADKEAQEEINTYFKTCEESGQWPGMDEIPVSAKEYNRITVTRKSIDPEIQITYPLNTAKIQENIQGTARNIPEGQTAWLLIYPHTAYKYYPINKLDIRDEKWSCPAQFGETKDVGTQFDIVVMLADQEAHEELANYLETCIETKTWPGIMTLPAGVKEYARVTVTRE